MGFGGLSPYRGSRPETSEPRRSGRFRTRNLLHGERAHRRWRAAVAAAVAAARWRLLRRRRHRLGRRRLLARLGEGVSRLDDLCGELLVQRRQRVRGDRFSSELSAEMSRVQLKDVSLRRRVGGMVW